MKFTFKNIGPVKKAELELGNLTIIAGRNNTGKSYIAHTLYSFLASFRLRFFFLYMSRHSARRSAREHLMPLKKENGKIVILQKDAEIFFNLTLRNISRSFSRMLHMNFAAAAEDFDGAAFSCEVLEFPTHSRGHRFYRRNEISDFSLKNGRFEIVFKDEKIGQNDKMLAVQEILFFYYSKILLIAPTALPAERMSIPVFYKEQDMSRSGYVDEIIQKDAGKISPIEAERFFRAVSRRVARYSRPIRDCISFTRDIEYAQKRKSEFFGSKLIDEIRSIIGGHYKYANDQILFIPKPNGGDRNAIPLHNASSSVQCFALLYFHLCHVARKGELFIIDEPEAHLDTANQIKLARLLARSVNAGLKVLITTHSDYLVKEFNNLIMLSSKFEGKAKLLKKFKYSEDDSLKQENVKAYICENGGLTPCKIDHQGMDMPIFDDAINSISDVSDELAFHLPESA